MASTSRVLANCSVATTTQYRRAVAEIVRGLQSAHHLTDLDFAEKIGCSIGTVRNARNEESDLGAIYLTRIEATFGTGSIDPYLRLAGSRCAPIEPDESADALPSTTAAIHKLAVARSPGSPGGETITHTELLEMAPEIESAIKALTNLQCLANKFKGAA
jgi:transcriptional regulator with XRE-family HTH domain